MKLPTRSSLISSASLCVLLICASGCASLEYTPQAPSTTLAASWTGDSEAEASPGKVRAFQVEIDAWWTAFGDEDLNQFVASVIDSNNDLASAAIAARRARLQAQATAASLGPQVSAGVSGSRSFGESDGSSFSASGQVGYELDIWGLASTERLSANLEATASEADRQATALSLTGSAVTQYLQLAYLKIRLEVADESLAYAEHTRDLVKIQYDVGEASRLEYAEAEQSVLSQRSSRLTIEQSIIETRNEIALLRDGVRLAEDDEPASLPSGTIAIASGLPGEILVRRPDLKAAELRLTATLHDIDATRLSYYPGISLTGSAGSSSDDLLDVLSNPVGTLAGSLAFPFLQANEMKLAIKTSQADYEAAALDFRQTLLAAFTEVENALSQRGQYAAQDAELSAALAHSETIEEIYEIRYRAGDVALRDWLDAQDSRRSAQMSLIENRLNQLNATTTLFLALGGDPATQLSETN